MSAKRSVLALVSTSSMSLMVGLLMTTLKFVGSGRSDILEPASVSSVDESMMGAAGVIDRVEPATTERGEKTPFVATGDVASGDCTGDCAIGECNVVVFGVVVFRAETNIFESISERTPISASGSGVLSLSTDISSSSGSGSIFGFVVDASMSRSSSIVNVCFPNCCWVVL